MIFEKAFCNTSRGGLLRFLVLCYLAGGAWNFVMKPNHLWSLY